MRDYKQELNERIKFVRAILSESHADGIVYGNSGGKDSALVGIICKAACENTIGIMLPCESKRNFEEDMADARAVAEQFSIETRVLDITDVKKTMTAALSPLTKLNPSALTNINPRLRMTALYAVAASENRIVAGTGNRSEAYMGYFTKYGDGGYDFNPIADLTVTEIYEFLGFLNAPRAIIEKAPSAGLFEGQTDEKEMGVTYKSIDTFLFTGKTDSRDEEIIARYHARSEHKRRMPATYSGKNNKTD